MTMCGKPFVRALALLGVLALVASGCGSNNTGGDTREGEVGDLVAAAEGLLWDNGPCDESKPPYPIGIITVFESPVLSLVDQATALEASVAAFNQRGGVGGHCMELTTWDSKGDPNREADGARQFVAKGIVATLNDTNPFNAQAVKEILEAAGLPRVGLSPSPEELDSEVTYAIGAGGSGSTFMMVPGCTRNGHQKIASIQVDLPIIDQLFGALEPMLEAYGAEVVAKIPVPAGTTDFQQFTLAAEKARATCAILPLGENEAVQVLQAAKQLGSKLKFSANLGTFGEADLAALGELAGQIYLAAELPPITGSQERWPILGQAIADLSASGEAELQEDQIKSSPFRSWVAVYSFVRIIEDFGDPDDVSREAIRAAFEAAKDVDHFDLIPPWTPSASVAGEGPFSSVSQPWYYLATFADGKFQVGDEQLHVLNELAGEIDYPQSGK